MHMHQDRRDRQEAGGWRPQEEQGAGEAEERCVYPNIC